MGEIGNVKETLDSVNDNFEIDLKMKKLKEEVLKSFNDYRKTLDFMAADAPISVLMLPTAVESKLKSVGCLRIYHLLNMDLTKIEGLNDIRIRDLTSRLDQFLSML